MNELLFNIERIHTTQLGIYRIKNNLKLMTNDVVKYCKNQILDERAYIYKKGKNFYCEVNGIIITINASSYTIITAHVMKTEKNIN